MTAATSTADESVILEVVEEPPVVAELVVETRAIASPRPSHWLWRLLAQIDAMWEWCFGVVGLIVALAVVATIPILQFLSLGYLLEVSGRVARTGRLSAGFVGMRKAARVASIAFGAWLLMWLPRLAHSMWVSARLIDPASPAARAWRVALILLCVYVTLHVMAASVQGGRLRHFLWPRFIRFIRRAFRPAAYAEVRDGLWKFVVDLRLPYYFWLGLRGFVGGLVWLVVPVSLLAAGRNYPGLGWLGAALLVLVAMLLPFLQTRMAATNRLRAMFAYRSVRQAFRHAPLAFGAALAITLAAALPLYLLKIELIPREAAWLPSLLFVMSIFPARLVCGWAMARAVRRERPRHWLFRFAARAIMVPVAMIYVLVIYFSQFLSWYGVGSLYEQHAFLLPVPFLGG